MKNVELGTFLKRKSITSICLGLLLVVSVVVGYIGKFNRLYEMTFISNILCGTGLLVCGFYIRTSGRDVPHFIYFDLTALLLLVLGIYFFFAPNAIWGFPSVIVHFVNPVLMLAFYFSYCDGRNVNAFSIVGALVVPLLYYLFMIIFGRLTGNSVYPYFDPNNWNVAMLVVWGVVASAIIFTIGLVIVAINRKVFACRERVKRDKNSKAEIANN